MAQFLLRNKDEVNKKTSEMRQSLATEHNYSPIDPQESMNLQPQNFIKFNLDKDAQEKSKLSIHNGFRKYA